MVFYCYDKKKKKTLWFPLLAVPRVGSQGTRLKPCMGVVQDALLGSYLLTSKDTFLRRDQFMQLIMNINYSTTRSPSQLPPPAVLKPVPLWTGKQLFSMFLPPVSLKKNVSGNSTLTATEKLMADETVVIRRGQLLTGKLCKQTLGPSSGGVIHAACKLLEPRTALNFMSDCQRVVNHWLEWQGVSIGLSDCIVDEKTAGKIDATIKACVSHIDEVSATGKQVGIPFHKREREISKILGKMLDITGGIIQAQLSDTNALNAMVKAGSKGNPINISQIMGCVGQQSIEGHRILNETNHDDRTLPCFPPWCDTVESHGFVKNSYVNGLDSTEMFFHTIGGREGIVDTSVKTADTG